MSVDLSEAKVPRTLGRMLAHAAHCLSAWRMTNDSETVRGSRIPLLPIGCEPDSVRQGSHEHVTGTLNTDDEERHKRQTNTSYSLAIYDCFYIFVHFLQR